MQIDGSTALVTGANRGFGQHLAQQLLARGAKVYAAARQPDRINLPGAIPLQLDITDPNSIRRAAEAAGDVTFLLNNAGISTPTNLLTGDLGRVRLEMETNFFGTLAVTRAFAPLIEANGGGAILNVLSALTWIHVPALGGTAATKSASWAMTEAVRQELGPKGIQVAGVHGSFLDTEMTAYVPADQKADPAKVAAYTLDEITAGSLEILADDITRQAKQQLSQPPTAA
ncbi:SDR family oxidoreductase [Streptomyces sp. 900105755]